MQSYRQAPCTHPPLAPAVQRCCDARNQVLSGNQPPKANFSSDNPNFDLASMAQSLASASLSLEANHNSEHAYRNAMPEPSTAEGIQDYVTCVLHGMTIGAINSSDGAMLLSGARVAMAAFRTRKKQSKKSAASTPATGTIQEV